MSFLNAEWRKLAIANYKVDDAILTKYLPPRTELDKWNGISYVSLVGFMFLNTRLLGIPIPFHRNFEEVNLRFYVRYRENGEWKRGVVFIKEIVPKFALTFVANTIYKEHYQTMKMKHQWEVNGNDRLTKYAWQYQNKWHSFTIHSEANPRPIDAGSETEFITEHYWGYTKAGPDATFEYEVTHPKWEVYPVKKYEVDVDFGAVYGLDFKFLNDLEPLSVMLAEGSEITVENKRRI